MVNTPLTPPLRALSKEEWLKLPLRMSRVVWVCRICNRNIDVGEMCRDGGGGTKKAHETCVSAMCDGSCKE